MQRREFIVGLGGVAAAWPLVARAQQPVMPVVGFLFSSTSKEVGPYIALTAGLAETSYVEGRNVALEYRMAEDHYERLPALANDLVRRRVALIFTASNLPPALAAKAATQTIPIVFVLGVAMKSRRLIISKSSAVLIGESPTLPKINITLRRKECDVAHTSLRLRRRCQRGD
jgi:putative tryptophan/tyrosine transport system substrate-binding protein